MRFQTITIVRDALRSQQRVILWLNCGHKVSVSQTQWDYLHHQPKAGDEWTCNFCPDREPTPEGKSATQMWHEAGEP